MIPLASMHPNGVTMRYCSPCAVAWAATERPECWVCGLKGTLRALNTWRNPGTWNSKEAGS